MTNDILLARILAACEGFERKGLSVASLQSSLEINASALEGVGNDVHSKLREFSNALETIQFTWPSETQYQKTCLVIEELREYLRSSSLLGMTPQMHAKLRYLHSPDVPDMATYTPEDPTHFSILVQAMVGPRGEQGEESFDFIVCTPRWLEATLSQDGFVFGRHYLIVPRYDYYLIWQAIEDLCNRTDGPDWTTIANKLGRYGQWEFEDYRDKEVEDAHP